VVVSGGIPAGNKRVTLYRSVADPPLYAAHLFAEHFRRAGGRLNGSIRVGGCPEDAKEIFRHDSVPLSMIVFGLNKFSNNFIADMLVRNLGVEPTVSSGLDEIRKWLLSASLDPKEVTLENGSGLSRKTRISAAVLSSALKAALNDFRYAAEFLASLPIAGTDGTFRRRLNGTDASSLVRAKSGQLSGAVALAGVAQTKSGSVVFAFLFNDVQGRESAIRDLEDRLLERIVSLTFE
jgi:D-alanyl-D-alanine carboxypeptidase/D-alanyl-D-alanine-endopeptidase (penicillin-binding protein 4)